MTQVSRELREAVESLTEDEAALVACLSEETKMYLDNGFYTDRVLEDVFGAIFQTYDLDESDWLDIEAAINEFVDDYWVEEDDLLDEAKRKGAAPKAAAKGAKKPGLISRALSWIGREAAKHAEKRLSRVKAEKGTTKHKLVHAARGALKQYASGKKGKAGEIAKRSAGKLVTKGAKSAVRKGMKMVFGTWRDTDKKGAPKKTNGAEPPKAEPPKTEPPKPEEKKKRKKKASEPTPMKFQGGSN
jgi:hypothetical protein